ncbi:hypothetical protein MKX01_021293 [Papaver californicum]|nr:hypothetical protein MKX01_021293 [Papaver californicum]
MKRDAEDRIVPHSVDPDDYDENSDKERDDNDTKALLAELEHIRKERNEERLSKERLELGEELKVKGAELIRGKYLVNSNASVKRRWDDDVVFKNQTCSEAKTPKRFINDTVRNDYHMKLSGRYMQ